MGGKKRGPQNPKGETILSIFDDLKPKIIAGELSSQKSVVETIFEIAINDFPGERGFSESNIKQIIRPKFNTLKNNNK